MTLTHLTTAVTARLPLLDEKHEIALRLFNGFLEGDPNLVVELYGRTLLLHNYANPPEAGQELATAALHHLLAQFPWVEAAVLKTRHAPTAEAKRGQLIHGTTPTRWVREHGLRHAVDLLLNRDASFYLDTRHLRQWLLQEMAGLRVLNTFAYTGSLGTAALAGGASQVIQTDLNKQFLNMAKTSYTLNGLPITKTDFQPADFWPHMNKLKRQGEQFDCIILDPPFFATTPHGTVDLASNTVKLLNKVRPLVRDNGRIVAINNALFHSGADYTAELQAICADGYVSLEETIPVPEDCTGYPHTRHTPPITDPAPFNHSTKIAILRVRRKASE
jgi:23S rRNA (cytosine1962-C5)-methyltransferase